MTLRNLQQVSSFGRTYLSITNLSIDIDMAVQIVGTLSSDGQLYLSVVHHQHMTNLTSVNDFWVRKHDAFVVSHSGIQIQSEGLALFQVFSSRVAEFTNLMMGYKSKCQNLNCGESHSTQLTCKQS